MNSQLADGRPLVLGLEVVGLDPSGLLCSFCLLGVVLGLFCGELLPLLRCLVILRDLGRLLSRVGEYSLVRLDS